jgi:hypothetical protein
MDVVIDSSEPKKEDWFQGAAKKVQTLYMPLKYTTMGKVGHWHVH